MRVLNFKGTDEKSEIQVLIIKSGFEGFYHVIIEESDKKYSEKLLNKIQIKNELGIDFSNNDFYEEGEKPDSGLILGDDKIILN